MKTIQIYDSFGDQLALLAYDPEKIPEPIEALDECFFTARDNYHIVDDMMGVTDRELYFLSLATDKGFIDITPPDNSEGYYELPDLNFQIEEDI